MFLSERIRAIIALLYYFQNVFYKGVDLNQLPIIIPVCSPGTKLDNDICSKYKTVFFENTKISLLECNIQPLNISLKLTLI